jgi:hypothetical protein
MNLGGNFCDEHGKAIKPAIIHDLNGHMGYVDKSDCMMSSYCISRHGNGKRSNSSIFWTLPFSTAVSFLPLVV